jgi:hypothetical protein
MLLLFIAVGKITLIRFSISLLHLLSEILEIGIIWLTNVAWITQLKCADNNYYWYRIWCVIEYLHFVFQHNKGHIGGSDNCIEVQSKIACWHKCRCMVVFYMFYSLCPKNILVGVNGEFELLWLLLLNLDSGAQFGKTWIAQLPYLLILGDHP